MPPSLDSGLDRHVDRTADHDRVLDVVAADEHKLAAPVHDRGFDHTKAPVALAQETGAAARSAPQDKGLERLDRERDERDDEKGGRDGEDDGVGVGHHRYLGRLAKPRSPIGPSLQILNRGANMARDQGETPHDGRMDCEARPWPLDETRTRRRIESDILIP
jgi:hypothetical protein